MDVDQPAKQFREFVQVVQALRTPGTGCPWDLEQDHRTLRPYLVEEAYEVLDAIDRGDDPALRDELGDLLLQVVLHAQVAADRGAFSIEEVVRGITDKMVRRHPHVFGSVRVTGSAEVRHNWEQIKAAERGDPGVPAASAALERLPEALPALLRAQRVGEKAERAGLVDGSIPATLNAVRGLFAQVEADVQAAATRVDAARALTPDARARLEHELGEVLFGLCQLARRLGLSAEDSLRGSTRRFIEQFGPPDPQTS